MSFGFPEKNGCVGFEGSGLGAFGLGGGAIETGFGRQKISEPSRIRAIRCPRSSSEEYFIATTSVCFSFFGLPRFDDFLVGTSSLAGNGLAEGETRVPPVLNFNIFLGVVLFGAS